MEELYSTYTGDPALAPWTPEVHLPIGTILANYILAFVLTTILVSARIFVRHTYVRKVQLDDWVLIAAYFAYTSYIIFLLYMALDIQLRGMVDAWWEAYMLISFRQFPYMLTSILVRASVATFFLRAIPQFEHTLPRIIIIVIFWLYASFVTANTFVNVWQCGNPADSGAFDSYYTDPTCLPDGVVIGMGKTAKYLNVALDWIMSLVPCFLVFQSSLQRKAKISAIGILILAGAGSSISVLGIVEFRSATVSYPSDLPHNFIFTLFNLWENGAAIIALSLAALRPLFERVRIGTKGSDSSQKSTLVGGALPSFARGNEVEKGGLVSTTTEC
ncbi:hypothetical protein K461DRAFT_318908 [Myriangium duriaei CBS 260.36]|uniref:Rhodopsin domain-containing protein n=1 Tax=Myriangium duriaei CBS 260.36 TaxID=1168546 RepID=A0A9P4JC81_9PEZI|nr:hypothetical protein K461DRAFT_318908 [Myriangium duriaei CBS 260.36]